MDNSLEIFLFLHAETDLSSRALTIPSIHFLKRQNVLI